MLALPGASSPGLALTEPKALKLCRLGLPSSWPYQLFFHPSGSPSLLLPTLFLSLIPGPVSSDTSPSGCLQQSLSTQLSALDQTF